MIRKTLLVIISILIVLFVFADNTSLKLRINDDQSISLSRFFHSVLPGKSFNIFIESENIDSVLVSCESGKLITRGNGKWKYVSPKNPGNYNIEIKDHSSNSEITLVVFVLTPSTELKGEYLNKYRIGSYPNEKYRGKKNYDKPLGFIEVTELNKNLFITPHFQLKQFLCKQISNWPKYLIINPKLVIKLEYLVDALQLLGHDVNTLSIMSGYRTPFYNKAIGNVKYSRHIYGDAADVYVDVNMDEVIDDLNGDGKYNMEDALVIHSLLSELENDPVNDHLIGGIGSYRKNSVHTYFIHVDTRGYRARW